jgi:hypothetical protein
MIYFGEFLSERNSILNTAARQGTAKIYDPECFKLGMVVLSGVQDKSSGHYKKAKIQH